MGDLKNLYGTVRNINGRTYVLDGTSDSKATAQKVADDERTDGRLARVIRMKRVRMANGSIRRNTWAILVSYD